MAADGVRRLLGNKRFLPLQESGCRASISIRWDVNSCYLVTNTVTPAGLYKNRSLPGRIQKTRRLDSSRSLLAELLLSDLLQMENEALEEDGFALPDGEPEDIRVDLERAASSGPLLAPRERKAGCKNFFWKTFTSC
ncbi:hypothetical protein GOODEAATRI_001418 [Goodea atripinnis]|uniref:Somatostatin/Cortistatin C-terminal domain-containing protein n=1 Tax=Goodea atripinnis TaxID=208336 RepID=A0ABV0PUC4_9TELE